MYIHGRKGGEKFMKKKIILPAVLALSVLVIGILTTNVAAQEAGFYSPIVEKIAERFNLNVSEVQEVFDERRAEMYARFADRLDEMVSEGKLTESQKEAILEKHEEMYDAMDDLRSLSPAERPERMREMHEEFRSWLEEQGIDTTLIGGFGKGSFRRGFKKGYGMGLEMGDGR
jgi:hypothetical protein